MGVQAMACCSPECSWGLGSTDSAAVRHPAKIGSDGHWLLLCFSWTAVASVVLTFGFDSRHVSHAVLRQLAATSAPAELCGMSV